MLYEWRRTLRLGFEWLLFSSLHWKGSVCGWSTLRTAPKKTCCQHLLARHLNIAFAVWFFMTFLRVLCRNGAFKGKQNLVEPFITFIRLLCGILRKSLRFDLDDLRKIDLGIVGCYSAAETDLNIELIQLRTFARGNENLSRLDFGNRLTVESSYCWRCTRLHALHMGIQRNFQNDFCFTVCYESSIGYLAWS